MPAAAGGAEATESADVTHAEPVSGDATEGAGDQAAEPGEQGLFELRRGLGLYPAIGQVVRGEEGVWLVHEATGARLFEVPAPSGRCERHLGSGIAVAFEGEPGVVLELSEEGLRLWQHDRQRRCAVSTDLLLDPKGAPETELHPLLELELTGDSRKRGSVVGEARRDAPIELGKPSERATVTLTAGTFEVRAAEGGKLLYSESFKPEPYCTLQATVRLGQRGEGEARTSLLVLRRNTQQPFENEDCDRVVEQSDEHQTETLTWVELDPDGSAHVTYSSWSPSMFAKDKGVTTRLFELPVGTLRFEASSQSRQIRERMERETDWSWSVVPDDGRAVILASTR